MPRRTSSVVVTALAAILGGVVLPATTAAAAGPLPVLHSGLVTRQDISSANGSEPDTVVEPDVAVDPAHPNVAIAAAHDSRFADGGARDISVAWTSDGGGTWHHQAVAGITKARGGAYDRASDPVVTFGPDGTAYLSVLVIDVNPCPTASAVLVLTSSNGGRTWSAPHTAVRSAICRVSEDKNWLVVDTGPNSPHKGRVYQFWTPFFYDASGNFTGSRQAVRWSDDHARTWSATSYISPADHATQNSQPMILANGSIVDTYYDFGSAAGGAPDAVPAGGSAGPSAARNDSGIAPQIVDNTGNILAARSDDGGRSWRLISEPAANGGGFAPGVRCCLFAADIDRATGIMYVAFEGAGLNNTDPVFLVESNDGGQLWTNPVQVSQGDRAGVQRVNVDVVAQRGSVYVSYGTRTEPNNNGGKVQQQISVSRNKGSSFGAPQSIGPVSLLQYAAQAGGYFPGDYIGEAIADGRLYVVFAVSSKPPASSSSPYHQVIWGVTLQP